jgi:hypothetical protein
VRRRRAGSSRRRRGRDAPDASRRQLAPSGVGERAASARAGWGQDPELPTDAACRRRLDLPMTRHGCCAVPSGGSPTPRDWRPVARACSCARSGVAPDRASSRSDLDRLHDRPSSRRILLAALASILEHELDRLADHQASLLQSLALSVDLGQLLHVGVDPAVAASSKTTLNLRALIYLETVAVKGGWASGTGMRTAGGLPLALR